MSDEDSSVSVHCDRDVVPCAGQNLIGGDLGGGQGTAVHPSTPADDSVVSLPVAFEAESKVQSELVDCFTPREDNSLLSGYDVDVKEDSSLESWRSKANEGQEGLFWRGPLLLKRVEDPLNGFRELVVLPKSLRRKILQLAHDHMGRAGIKAMVRILRGCVAWPGIYKDVSGY